MMVKANMTERIINLVVPLAHEATAMRTTDTTGTSRDRSGAVSPLIGLDLQGRSDLIAWLDGLVEPGEIQSAILFGTLKALPSGLPDSFEAIWIDQGIAEQIKEAA